MTRLLLVVSACTVLLLAGYGLGLRAGTARLAHLDEHAERYLAESAAAACLDRGEP